MTDAPHPPGPPYSTDDARWLAVVARDPAADGHFVYAVTTTGVYGHPSAASRRPRRANVLFFSNAALAEAAGYRASERRGADRSAAETARAGLIAATCRRIAKAETRLNLAELAGAAGLSPAHFHRVFKAETGLTPRQYAAACRAGRVRTQLSDGQGTVTDALYDAGFESSGRFYAASDRILGMAPRAYRGAGTGQAIRFAVGQCSLGAILVAESDRGLCAILMGDDAEALVEDLQDRFRKATLIGGDAAFEARVAEVVGFVEAPSLGLALPLDVQGTAFQERVWQALRAVPAGTTVTYADLAQVIGAPKAVRAVAGACAANRLAVAIPCHRVVRRDGDISGYRWGVERKRELLRREREA